MNQEMKKIVAITACPVGIAHTYMAAENLQKAGTDMGIQMKVETHGSIGIENKLTAQEIREADGIIIASDKGIDKSRFQGKRIVNVGVQEGIRHPEKLINQIINGEAKIYGTAQTATQMNETEAETKSKRENNIYKHLMNGVSYMVPFVVIGGLLIAIALTLGGVATPEGVVIPEGSIWATINDIGGAAMTFMIPILSAFIAYSIADRPGLAPGMVGGFIAANGSFYGSEAGAGFIGGIVAGFLAGYVALGIKKIKVPKAIQSIMPIIIIPILTTLIVGLLFVFFIGKPVSVFFEYLTVWLASMQGSSSIILALILGAMISVDMGGPFNKVAFLFGSGMIAEGNYEIMGPIAVAICIPPIGLGLATFLLKNKFSKTEKETGKASFAMGLFGITEGAIPFASQDPLRVIPSIVVGSMAGSVVAMLSNVGDRVAHGGPIVAVLGAVDNVLMFFVAVIVGCLVTVMMLNFLKKDVSARAIPAVEIPNEKSPIVESGVTETTKQPLVETSEKEITKLTDILTLDLIDLDLKSDSKETIMDELIEKFDQNGVLSSSADYKQAILTRESESSTGIGMNIAIPHGKSSAVKTPSVVFGRKIEGVEWESLDGSPARLIFMIAVPSEAQNNAHLKILQMLSRRLMDDQFRESLLTVETKEEAYALLDTIS